MSLYAIHIGFVLLSSITCAVGGNISILNSGVIVFHEHLKLFLITNATKCNSKRTLVSRLACLTKCTPLLCRFIEHLLEVPEVALSITQQNVLALQHTLDVTNIRLVFWVNQFASLNIRHTCEHSLHNDTDRFGTILRGLHNSRQITGQ